MLRLQAVSHLFLLLSGKTLYFNYDLEDKITSMTYEFDGELDLNLIDLEMENCSSRSTKKSKTMAGPMKIGSN